MVAKVMPLMGTIGGGFHLILDFERRCWAEINLDQLKANYKIIEKAANGAEVMAVVKANAYGHGDIVAARALLDAGAQRFAVSGLVEAVRLRRAGIRCPILVLGYTSPHHASLLALHNIEQCIFDADYARELSAAASKAGVQLVAHIKVDTGMGRLGFNAKDDIASAVREIAETCALPALHAKYLFSHFSAADSLTKEDIAYTNNQYKILCEARAQLANMGICFEKIHICNSAGLIAQPNMHLDIVRPGIVLYGCNPSPDVTLPGLQPAFSLKTVVTTVKRMKKGDCVSYGRTFTAPRDMTVAALAVGYADGYPRLLSQKGIVDINGKPAPILGRVCMDQTVVDVSEIPDVHLGSIATVISGNAGDNIDSVAAKCDTINYEILCNIGRRVQRVYIENGCETLVADYMQT